MAAQDRVEAGKVDRSRDDLVDAAGKRLSERAVHERFGLADDPRPLAAELLGRADPAGRRPRSAFEAAQPHGVGESFLVDQPERADLAAVGGALDRRALAGADRVGIQHEPSEAVRHRNLSRQVPVDDSGVLAGCRRDPGNAQVRGSESRKASTARRTASGASVCG